MLLLIVTFFPLSSLHSCIPLLIFVMFWGLISIFYFYIVLFYFVLIFNFILCFVSLCFTIEKVARTGENRRKKEIMKCRKILTFGHMLEPHF